jgi:hypothetical protein
MLEVLRTRVLAEPWLLLLVLALGSYFVLVHRPRAAAKQKADKARREAIEWRSTRYRRWQEERQHAEPGLRPALLRLALASLLQPRLAAQARAGTADLPGDVVGLVGDAGEGALRFCGVLAGHTNWVTSAAFSPDGLKIVSASGNPYGHSTDNTVRVWSAITGDCEHTMQGHTKAVTSAAFSPEGRQIVSASSDSTVRVWEVAME